jgi:hypothetical protein
VYAILAAPLLKGFQMVIHATVVFEEAIIAGDTKA